MGVGSTDLYAAGHTRIHSQLAAAPNLTLAIVKVHVMLWINKASLAQASHIIETAMGNQQTVIYIRVLQRAAAARTLHMTVGGCRIVKFVAQKIHPAMARQDKSVLFSVDVGTRAFLT